ncbi:MAG: ROK family protein [bacterium]|nr:ROK family protein [bacterium]
MTRDLYLGVDAGGTAIKYEIDDADGMAVGGGEVPTDPTDVAHTLRTLAADAAARLGGPGLPRLAAAGLACAGIVNPVTGWLGRSPNLPGWQNRDLGGAMAAAFGDVPVALANDVNCALYGEFRYGAGRGCRDVVMIALGTGVGGAVIVNGSLLIGSHFGAGEIGHMVLEADGPLCTCGSRGCLEAWSGSTGLLRATREALASGAASPALQALAQRRGAALETRDLADLAGDGDAVAREIFAEAGRRLGQAVANLVNVLDPDRIIIGGGVARAGELILGPCHERALPLILATAARSLPIVPAELGPRAAAVGAASLAREKARGSH